MREITSILDERKSIQLYVAILIFLAMSLVSIKLVYTLFCAIKYTFPGEIRGAANTLWAYAVSKGLNVYDLHNSSDVFATYCTVYTSLSLFFVGLFSRLFGISVIKTAYCSQVISLIATAIINSISVYSFRRKKRYLVFVISVFASTLSTFLYASGKPGQFAVFLICLAMLLNFKEKYPWLQAIMIVAAFWDKQYFVVFAVPFFLFYLYKRNWKRLTEFCLTGMGLGITSILIVWKYFPLYFIESFISRSIDEGMTSEQYVLNAAIHHSIDQMLWIGKKYLVYLVMIFVGILSCAIWRKHKLNIYDFCSIFVFAFLLYFGMGSGNYLVYHMEMLVPPLIVSGLICSIECLEQLDKKYKVYAGVICTILLIVNVYKTEETHIKVLSPQEAKTYQCLYDFIDQYDGNIYLGAAAAQYAIDHEGKYMVSNGLSGYFTGMVHGLMRGTKEDSEIYTKYIPETPKIIDKAREYREMRKEMLDNKVFSLVVYTESIDTEIKKDGLESKYHIVKEFEITNTAEQTWIVSCWEPNR